jgi:hypothetical protein
MSRPTPNWFGSVLRLSLFSLLALVVLLGTGLLFAGALAVVNGGGVANPGNLSVGLVCGLISWLFVAAFHLRKETIAIPATDPERFVQNARLLLTEMGYEVKSRGQLQLSTRPRFHSLLFGSGIQVELDGAGAHLTGPKVCVEVLRNRLRILSHLGVVRQALLDPHRHSETLIKRAELRLRVTPEQFEAVRTNVIDVLQATADVLCDVHLLAQSDIGIPESTLEFQIKQWLDEMGIEATVHKHFIQLHRPLSNTEIILEDAV